MAANKLLLIDSSALIHRAFYATQNAPTFTQAGEQTNAVHGFFTMVAGLIEREQPDCLAFAFEGGGRTTGGQTFRHKLDPTYKANRAPTPNELINQIPRIQEIVSYLGVPLYQAGGFEADDILGMLATAAVKEGDCEVLIATGDRDLYQLISDKVKVLIPAHGQPFSAAVPIGIEEFQEEWGFDPIYFAHYKALAGDSADNIKGVKGIGPKAATALIKTYGTINEALDKAAHTPRMWQNASQKLLLASQDAALNSLALATIHTDEKLASIKYDRVRAALGYNIDGPCLLAVFKELGMPNLAARFLAFRRTGVPAPRPVQKRFFN